VEAQLVRIETISSRKLLEIAGPMTPRKFQYQNFVEVGWVAFFQLFDRFAGS
jgi:hypothetical protein